MAQIRKIWLITGIIAVLIVSSAPLLGQGAEAADSKVLNLLPMPLPKKGHPKLDSRLDQLVTAESRGQAAAFAQQSNIRLIGGRVRVIVESEPGQANAARNAATALGAGVETGYRDLLQVVMPIPALTALANAPSTRFVRLPYQAMPVVTSEGVALIDADDWQTASYNGTGVKVAILDLGFSGYMTRQSEGELPASVTTWWAPSIGNEGTEVHGTACAEIIYDIAPGAQFYLANFDTDVEWYNAVDWAIAQGVNVVSHSIVWLVAGPGDGTGSICAKVDAARAAGILWSQSIGNYAERHWQGNFVDTDSDGWHEFNQSPFDETNTISAGTGQTIIVGLKWDDTWGASGNDYDLYLIHDNGSTILAYSINRQNGDDDPTEWLQYTATYPGSYHIAIAKYGSPAVVNFHLFSYNHNLQYQVASSSFELPADSASAMSVGAVYWNTPTTIESFSSQGPTKDSRVKPDIVAPDGVSTRTYGTSFRGTSASAPHTAGAAVLVKQRYPFYTPAQIQAFLEGRAVELGAAGKDNVYGSGRLLLDTPSPAWDSYRGNYGDSGGTQNDYFDDYNSEHTVYMYGTGFTASTTYKVVYWDGTTKRTVDTVAASADGKLKSHWTFTTGNATAGNWHVTVYTWDSDPQSYPDNNAYVVADDASYTGGYSFYVAESAIPEFPTAWAAIAALALSVGVYLWLRRRVSPVPA